MAEELSEPKVVQESAVSAAAMQGHEPFSGDKMRNAEDCALIDESGGSENGKRERERERVKVVVNLCKIHEEPWGLVE